MPARFPQRTRLLSGIAALCCALASSGAHAYAAKVVRVTSGDTVVIAADGKQATIRLGEVDAPEQGQPYSEQARQALTSLCLNQAVEVTPLEDAYGSKVARVACQGRDAGEAQVAGGMAWVLREFSQGAGRLYDLEHDAQSAKRGLWAEQSPTPPWLWRKGNRSAAAE